MKIRFLLAALISLMALPAAAQTTPAFDVSGGYSYLRDAANFNGWFASVAGNVSPTLGVVGEVGGNYKDPVSLHTFMVGPRLVSRNSDAFTPWAQVLVGAARSSVDVGGLSASTTGFSVQPGVGVDYWVAPHKGVRVGVDYRRIFGDTDTNQLRFTVGVVLEFGSR